MEASPARLVKSQTPPLGLASEAVDSALTVWGEAAARSASVRPRKL